MTLMQRIEKDSEYSGIVLKGTQNVGGAILDSLNKMGIGDKIVGLVGRNGGVIRPNMSDIRCFRDGGTGRESLIEQKGTRGTLLDMCQELREDDIEPIIIDASNDPTLGLYQGLLSHHIRLITMNKYEGALGDPDEVMEMMKNPNFGYDATVMAGQGAITRLQQEMEVPVGKILSVSGILSGSIAGTCKELEMGVPFSEAIYNAMKRGDTEPNPMDDYDGMDVGKKIVKSARTINIPARLDGDNVTITGLLDDSFREVFDDIKRDIESNYNMQAISKDERDQMNEDIRRTFADKIKESGADDRMKDLIDTNKEQGKVPRYIGKIDMTDGEPIITVGLEFLKPDSELGSAENNKMIIEVDRGNGELDPVGVLGKGAGPFVTTAGALRDVHRVLGRK